MGKPIDLKIEKSYWSQYKHIAGLDEAGRGAWAGPVVCGAVIISPDSPILSEVQDSKKLTPKKRDELYQKICDQSVAYGIGFCYHDQIDEINILQATKLAMKLAVEQLKIQPNLLLIDGKNMEIDYTCEQKSIIDGDNLCYSIAAASILAKVTRDRLMVDLAKEYPQYGFEKHKGYGTKVHREALVKHGCSDIHRKSYKPIQKILLT